METRAQTTAATRAALVEAATQLLDEGGPEAVTLRGVGARAGVTRSAPYRHFRGKDALLDAVAGSSWRVLGEELTDLGDAGSAGGDALSRALRTFVTLARTRPYRYRLMFEIAEPSADTLAAAASTHDRFLGLVVPVVTGDARPFAALLLAAAHGIADLDLAGHLPPEKWGATPTDLLDLLSSLMTADRRSGS